ncbi:MAG: hypothetical protein IJ991_00060, partial [Thermoguttaceae bacterium]|nr:hypothetical protein [Thermoguttaceae bacterium]
AACVLRDAVGLRLSPGIGWPRLITLRQTVLTLDLAAGSLTSIRADGRRFNAESQGGPVD